jgi:hypothetical protein
VSTAAANGLDARRDFAEAFLAATLMQAGRREEAEPLWAKAWSAAIARGDAYNLSTLRGGMNSALEKAGLPPLEQDGSLPV